MNDKELMEKYLSNFNNGVAENVTIVSPSELGQRWLYHISLDPKIKQFVPSLTRRTAQKEDRTVPRISTAPTIIGCILGYQNDINEFLDNDVDDGWKGGWYIYGFESEVSLLPKKKLLTDVRISDERWLVPYTAKKWSYPAKVIGKFFYRTVSTQNVLKGNSIWEVEVVFEVNRGCEVRAFKGLTLTEGYWIMTFTRSMKEWDSEDAQNVRQLSSSEYKGIKVLHADMLSYQEPPSAHW